jgi:membrane protein
MTAPAPDTDPRTLLMRGRRAAVTLYRACRSVLRGYRGEKISLRAAALTYFTIFSLVPLVTVILVTLESLHQQAFHDRVHSFIRDVLAPGVQKDSAEAIERLLTAASSLALRGIGYVTLAVSAGSLLKNLDESLNDLWNINLRRTWGARLFQYALALTVGPVLLALSLAGTAGVRRSLLHLGWPGMGLLTAVIPVVASALGLTALYVVAPNTRVNRRAALAGALVSTIGWELAKHAYAAFAAGIFRYNVLYGSLGAVPLFLLWVYVSWVLVLFGARLAFALQHASALERLSALRAHPRGEELFALCIARALARAELEGLRPVTVRELARRANVPEQELTPLLRRFARHELVHLHRGKVALARDPHAMRLAEVHALFGPEGATGFPSDLARLIQVLDPAAQGVSWADLGELPPATQPAASVEAAVETLRKP